MATPRSTRPTNKQRRRDARAARLAAERAAAARERRRRRLWQLAAAIVLAVLVVGAAIVISERDTSAPSGHSVADAAQVGQMLDGIPQHGIELGRPDAPVRLVEFADLKCPICRSYSQQVLPQLIQRYVRAGRVRMEFRVQHFVGEQRNPGDSLAAARMLQAVGSQNRLWNFAELFYYNQQGENQRYVTDGFVRGLAGAVHGLDVQRALRQRDDPGVDKALSSSEALFTANGFTGTPSFLIGRGSGPLRPLTWQRLTVSEFADPIQKLLGK